MTFLPDEYGHAYSAKQSELVRQVYQSVVAEHWFTQSAEKRAEFAEKVLRIVERGLVDKEQLHKFCLKMAEAHYSEEPELIAKGQAGRR